ncbi:hypothetical protein [Neptuniibacter sp. QD37_11]|uniref:hypothetical protein n=1 Tax=Neptuniibacter sp. QD37_11 TaxID=3398209 RepID=UPI0039F5A9EB
MSNQAKQAVNNTSFMFEVGQSYATQKGKVIKVLDRTTSRGYECLVCSDKKHRYDRSTHSEDAGRVTATNHDFSCPDNLVRPPVPVNQLIQL